MTSASGSSGATLYGQRLQAFAHHLQLPDPAQLIDEGLLRVGATNVRLHFDPELDGNAIWLRLDLGVLATDHVLAVSTSVLQANCTTGIGAGAVFGFMPTGADHFHLALAVCLPLQTLAEPVHFSRLLSRIVTAAQADKSLLDGAPVAPVELLAPAIVDQIKSTLSNRQAVFERFQWERLLTELAHALNLQNATKLVADGLITVGGVDMQLLFRESRSDKFELRVDVGTPPAEIAPEISHQGLLLNNFAGGFGNPIEWALHPVTGHVVAVIHHDLSCDEKVTTLPTGKNLADLLSSTAKDMKSYWAPYRQALAAR